MPSKYRGIIIVILLIAVGGYFLLRGSYQAPVSIPTPAPTRAPEKTEEPTKIPSATEVPISEVKEISVVGTEFSFDPASISVKSGNKVKLTFKNNGRAPHNLIVEGLGVGTKTIGAGQKDTIEFETLSAGTYAFFCSISGHRASGMEGNLKVE